MMAATEKRYENREHERGAVTASVPEDFTDLSTVHHSLGSLSVQVNALRIEVIDPKLDEPGDLSVYFIVICHSYEQSCNMLQILMLFRDSINGSMYIYHSD